MQGEEWRPVLSWEDLYEVSSMGRVRSLDRPPRGGLRGWTGKPIKPRANVRNHYPTVTLSRDGKVTHRTVHSLVAEAFHGPRPEGMEVRHLDGVAENVAAANLAWGTVGENAADRVAHGTASGPHGPRTKRDTCVRLGHPLRAPNLRASKVLCGERSCLACSRAGNAVRYAASQGRELDFTAEANRQYARIMEAAA